MREYMERNYTPKDIFAVAREEAEVKELDNNDVYKFYMLDFILHHPEYKGLEIEWEMTIRSQDVRTADVIPKEELIAQLQAVKDINWIPEESLNYLASITDKVSWKRTISDETIDFLRTFKLPDFSVEDNWEWNYKMKFHWLWENSIMWEIYGLKIINTLYLYNYVKKAELSDSEFDKIIKTTFKRLFDDIEIFKIESRTQFSEFWTRRSMSTDYQRMVNLILEAELPGQYLWTSNVMMAREMWHKRAIWTNAHELRMIPTALYDDPADIIAEMYDIDRKWQAHYPNMALLLPDTYGTTYYLNNAPQDVIVNHIWQRFDSKNPMIAIPEYIEWLLKNWQDPMTKSAIPSDWLNARTSVEITKAFHGKVWFLASWNWTHLSNNTKWTWPRETEPYGPFWSFSVVVKPCRVKRPDGTWVSTVKLSDNPDKAVWETNRVDKFKKIFWSDGVEVQEVLV